MGICSEPAVMLRATSARFGEVVILPEPAPLAEAEELPPSSLERVPVNDALKLASFSWIFCTCAKIVVASDDALTPGREHAANQSTLQSTSAEPASKRGLPRGPMGSLLEPITNGFPPHPAAPIA